MMKGYKKGTVILTLLVMLMCVPSRIWGATQNGQLDAVLVIDASGSMQDTDPNKLGLEGVKLFVDMMAATGNQVGIVSYGSYVNQSYPLQVVKTGTDKENIKRFVDGLNRDLEYTDITVGLGKALEMENQRDTSLNNNPLIIIFTDGNNAVGGVSGRDSQKIDQDLAVMLDEARSKGYPIYTIGLNDNGKLNEAYLKHISDETGAIAFATKDPDELPDILTQIFAAHSNLKVQNLGTLQGTGDFEEVIVNIPNKNVLEANISATSKEPLTFKLEDPNGESKTIPSNEVTLHESGFYQLLKIARPMEGDWKLYVKGAAGEQINIDLVYNYDIEVTMEDIKSKQFSKGDTLKVGAYLSLQGSSIDDDALYQSGKATLIIRNTDNGKEIREPMKTKNQRFEGSYKLKEEGNFEVSVLVEDTSYQRESNSTSFTVEKGGLFASDSSNTVEEGKSPLLFVVGGIIILVVIIGGAVFIKVLKDAKRPLVGQMVIEIREHATGKLTPPQYKKLSVFQGKVSLHALLQFAPELKETEGIVFKSVAGDKVMLYNQSAYVIEKSGRVVKTEGGLEIKKGDRYSINLADIGQTVQIEYLL